MGLRFRKSKNIAPGIRLNVTKNGIGATFGGKAGRISVSPKGQVTASASIPGTGISYSERIKSTDSGNKFVPSYKESRLTKIACEACNSNSFSDEGGYLVCDYCGTKYAKDFVGADFVQPESRNDVESTVQKKWYQKTGWIIFFIILFPPIGIAMAWITKNNWSNTAKIVVTVFFALLFILAIAYS